MACPLIKGRPIGAMVTGDGGIGRESLSTLFKDLRHQLSRNDLTASHTVGQIAGEAAAFFRDKLAQEGGGVGWILVRFCGYSTGRPLPEIWDITMRGQTCGDPQGVQDEAAFGLTCEGRYEAFHRLWLGFSPRLQGVAAKLGIEGERWDELAQTIMAETMEPFVAAAMPIQDAIDLARYLVEMTAGFVRFSLREQPKTVGGPVELAAITKHEGFRWVQRRHFYPPSLNPALEAE